MLPLTLCLDQLCVTVLNPWQWYCSTRTFSNSLEMALTIIALNFWPWELVGDATEAHGGIASRRERLNRCVAGYQSCEVLPDY